MYPKQTQSVHSDFLRIFVHYFDLIKITRSATLPWLLAIFPYLVSTENPYFWKMPSERKQISAYITLNEDIHRHL